MCPRYKCILLYVKLIQCSGIMQIYDEMEERYICPEYIALCYMLNLFGIVVFHRSMVSWKEGLGICAFCFMLNLCGVVVSIHLWSIGGGGHWYMCILLYVKLIWCSGIPYIYG